MRSVVLPVLLVLFAARTASAQGPSLCRAAVEALKIDVNGTTVFCPSNAGFMRLARILGFRNVEAMLAGVSPDVLSQVVSFHVVPNGIRTSASLPRRATVPTRLGAGRDGSMTINKPRRTSIAGMDVRYRTIDADDDPSDPRRVENDDSDVEAADVTLSGAPYRAGADGHVVHVIEDVMVPVVAGPLLRLVRWNNRMGRHKLL